MEVWPTFFTRDRHAGEPGTRHASSDLTVSTLCRATVSARFPQGLLDFPTGFLEGS